MTLNELYCMKTVQNFLLLLIILSVSCIFIGSVDHIPTQLVTIKFTLYLCLEICTQVQMR